MSRKKITKKKKKTSEIFTKQVEKKGNKSRKHRTTSSLYHQADTVSSVNVAPINFHDVTANWKDLGLNDRLLKTLATLNYVNPTEIQLKCIREVLDGKKDVLAAAQTGSGKTLAFLLPIFHRLLSKSEEVKEDEKMEEKKKKKEISKFEKIDLAQEYQLNDMQMDFGKDDHLKNLFDKDDDDDHPTDLFTLILTPTRDLAVQIKANCSSLSQSTSIKTCVVVGGLSIVKQKRQLSSSPHIVVGTPGRLIQLMEMNLLKPLRYVKTVVVDEVDRMIEGGQFEDLLKIFQYLNQCSDECKSNRQLMVFSATLTAIPSIRLTTTSTVQEIEKSKMEKIDEIIGKLPFRSDRSIVDISRRQIMASSLLEKKLMCSTKEKEAFLFLFLLMNRGRSIIFVNSTNTVRKLTSILKQLFDLQSTKNKCHLLTLHGNLHEKQRLKNIESFCRNDNTALIATDVAARGLDIPSVDNVIHFHVPKTFESYVHRSGRTARCNKSGISVMFLSDNEWHSYSKIITSLCQNESEEKVEIDMNRIEEFTFEELCKVKTTIKESSLNQIDINNRRIVDELKKKVKQLAQYVMKIEHLSHQLKKKKFEENWLSKMAKEADLDLNEALNNYQPTSNKELRAMERQERNEQTADVKEVTKRMKIDFIEFEELMQQLQT
ncbi:hypothetical protein SNEBB_005963 [Seison nebaliae]|nr:hypothetical protein SNEBB_005963 [Seison nebaliae]